MQSLIKFINDNNISILYFSDATAPRIVETIKEYVTNILIGKGRQLPSYTDHILDNNEKVGRDSSNLMIAIKMMLRSKRHCDRDYIRRGKLNDYMRNINEALKSKGPCIFDTSNRMVSCPNNDIIFM